MSLWNASLVHSIAICFCYALAYVGVLYIHPKSRPTAKIRTTDSDVIKLRIISVSPVVFGCLYLTHLQINSGQLQSSQWSTLGVSKFSINDIGYALITTASLFSGPLYEWIIAERGYRNMVISLKSEMSSILGWRNYIYVRINRAKLFKKSYTNFFFKRRLLLRNLSLEQACCRFCFHTCHLCRLFF